MIRRVLTCTALVCGISLAAGAIGGAVQRFHSGRDLRADLFFLAGDRFKGRLVGTAENALAADWVRSRFERAGLKPGRPERIVRPADAADGGDAGEGNRLDVALADGTTLSHRTEQEFYPQRFSASGTVKAAVVYAGFGIHAPKLGYDDYGDRVKGRIALILEHEPGERDPASPFDGLVTAEPAVAIKKALAAQDKGAVGVLFVSDVHNHPAAQNFEAAARAYWPPQPPRIDHFTLAQLGRSRAHPGGADLAGAGRDARAGTGRSLIDLAEGGGDGKGLRRGRPSTACR